MLGRFTEMKNIWSLPTVASTAIAALALLGAAPHGRTIVQPPHIVAPAPPVTQPRPPYIIAPPSRPAVAPATNTRPASMPATGALPAARPASAESHIPVDPKPVQPAVNRPPQ